MPVPKLLVTAAMFAANMALTMTQKINGPRLDDLKFTNGDYGAPLTMFWAMRRLNCPIFWAEDLREIKRKRKTKGGKYNEFTYYGTWAVAVAGHEISSIRRIYFDTHLIYDLSGTGPVTPFDFGGRGNVSDFITIYLGTTTQNPDPRMQATVEAEHGEGSCPAYRGTAYIVFKDIPLEKLGNRIPQISVEALSVDGDIFPTDSLTASSETAYLTLSSNGTMFCGNYTEYSIIDIAARAEIFTGPFSPTLIDNSQAVGFLLDGSVIGTRSGNNLQYPIGGAGTEIVNYGSIGLDSQTSLMGCYDSNDNFHYITSPLFAGSASCFNGAVFDPELASGDDTWVATWLIPDNDGGVWATGCSGSTAHFYRVSGAGDGPDYITCTGLPSGGSSGGGNLWGCHYMDSDVDHFVFPWNDVLYAVPRQTGGAASFTNSSLAFSGGDAKETFRNVVFGATSVWIGFEEISLADLTRIRLLDPDDWGLGPSWNSYVVYDSINHALISTQNPTLTWNFLDRIASPGVTLGEICGDVSDLCNVDDYNFTDLNQIVEGWSATQGQVSNIVEPLLDTYDSDFRSHDFQIQGIKRSGVSGGTILTERFVAKETRYTAKIRQSQELPRAVVINFADIDADQQVNNVRSDRPLETTGARGEQTIDMTTLALDADTARAYGDRYFRRVWNSRKEVNSSLTAQQLALEPGDCITLNLDGEADIYRLTRLTIQSDDILDTEWKYDHPSLALTTTTAGASFDGRNVSVVIIPLISKGFFLDIPLIDDADDQLTPALYLAAAPYTVGAWPGAVMFQEIGGEYTEEIGSVASSSQATWGYATDALGDVATPWMWDRSNSVNVRLQVGSLSGTTEAAINIDHSLNQFILKSGTYWEIAQFTTATLEGDGTYTLSGFKRGRRGTEWATGGHLIGDVFLLLDTAEDTALGLSDVGTNMSFKAITSGRTTGFPEDIEPFTGASLKPYAPSHVHAIKQDNGDWIIYGIRRTRVGGDWTSGTPIPLSEVSEEYQLDLSDGVDTVTKTTSSLPYTWTQANQVTDVGAEVMIGGLEVAVYQISDSVGRGYATEITA